MPKILSFVPGSQIFVRLRSIVVLIRLFITNPIVLRSRTNIRDPGTNNSDPGTSIRDPGTNNSNPRTNICDPRTNNSNTRTNFSESTPNIWMRNAQIFVHKLLVSDLPNISCQPLDQT